MLHKNALPLATFVWRAGVLSKSAVGYVGWNKLKFSIPGGSSHGLRPAVAVLGSEVVLVLAGPAPARSQGLGGRAAKGSKR